MKGAGEWEVESSLTRLGEPEAFSEGKRKREEIE